MDSALAALVKFCENTSCPVCPHFDTIVSADGDTIWPLCTVDHDTGLSEHVDIGMKLKDCWAVLP